MRLGIETTALTAKSSVDADILVRSILFVCAFLLVWVTFRPFQSLADPPHQISEGGDWLNQIGFLVFFLVFAAWAYANDIRKLRPLLSPVLIATLMWFALCVVTSWEPALSARRLAFTLIVISISAVTLQLPKNLRHFSDLLAVSTLIVLALCYFGVLFLPDVAVHQAGDFLEPEHEGSWRGVFSHKNEAGATMAIFILIGLFVARVRNIALGGTIVALSTIFLVMSQSKTSLLVLPLVMIVCAGIRRMRSYRAAILGAVGGLVLFNMFTIGSIYFEPVQELLRLIIADTSFTGRTDIWKFAVQELARSPIHGYGFAAFWGTPQVVYGLQDSSNWASAATDAHNAYLNLAVTVGLPGLLLIIIWLVFRPAVHFFRQIHNPGNDALAIFFLRIWLFGLYASCFESMILQQNGAVWFVFIMAVFGLHQLTFARVRF